MPKVVDVSGKTKEELLNLVANYRKHQRTNHPTYLAALEELAIRKGSKLEFRKSCRIILEAARERRFLSYKQLADESGAEWDKVMRSIGSHLGDLISYAHDQGWPMLSAIVVNQQHLKTGKMEPDTLKGFIAAAHWLRRTDVGPSDEAFLRHEQEQVFAWAHGRSDL